jgi:hypothetical protein
MNLLRAIAFGMLWPSLAIAQSALPDRNLTPGAINPAVTEQNIDSTICQRGWTASVRPSYHITERLKRAQINNYGYDDRKIWHYEEDHLIPLDLGGAPANPRNLWPEPHLRPGQWGSYAKDRLEARLGQLVCHYKLTINHARALIARDWISAYRRFIGPTPNNAPLRRYSNERKNHWHHHWHHHWHQNW